jgi:quercetin dioxygenase-like cupin family protein
MAVEPQVVWMPGGVRTEIHLTGADTGGVFCLLVDQPAAGWDLPAHLHEDAAETIHVVEGEFEMTIDGATERLAAGQSVHVPAGVVHSSRNVGASPGRRVLIFGPAGMEDFFIEAGAATPGAGVDREAIAAAAIRHSWRFVDPP